MTASEIAGYRLVSQQITETIYRTASEMVAWFGAVQAQEYALTKWGLGLRLPHLTDHHIEQDFTSGKILRTHLLRPTWHFVTAEDIRWMLRLTAPRVNAANAFMYRKMELDDAVFNRCNDILVKELEGGKQHTREALNGAFKRQHIHAEGHRLSYIMMRAELEGIICSGARHGNQFTYALLEERIPATNSKNHDEALAELTKRYFTSRGPATLKDFSTWSGLTLSACKSGIGMLESHFEKVLVENEVYYFSSGPAAAKNISQTVHLLPIYDELIMGYKNRDAFFQYRNSFQTPSPLRFDNMILMNDQVAGTWKRTVKTKHIELEYNFFRPSNNVQFIDFEQAAQRFQSFTGMEVIPEAVPDR